MIPLAFRSKWATNADTLRCFDLKSYTCVKEETAVSAGPQPASYWSRSWCVRYRFSCSSDTINGGSAACSVVLPVRVREHVQGASGRLAAQRVGLPGVVAAAHSALPDIRRHRYHRPRHWDVEIHVDRSRSRLRCCHDLLQGCSRVTRASVWDHRY